MSPGRRFIFPALQQSCEGRAEVCGVSQCVTLTLGFYIFIKLLHPCL